MRFRQVHLDFHTGEHVPGVGARFDKQQFQNALRIGHVDSISVFSKCHHGWAYHKTEANKMHPTLGDFELLTAQIEAAHEIGVRAPIYISAGHDEHAAHEHPEWIIRSYEERGLTSSPNDFTRPGYHRLCFNSPYLDLLIAQTREVCQKYAPLGIDGLFFDIVGVQPCWCSHCQQTLRDRGLDPEDPANIMALAEETHATYARRIRETVDETDPSIHVFHNSGHITRGRRDLANMSTHYELESLPTGGWGYDHFPLSARYVQQFGVDYLGMTGKFHRSWGEFGGFKHPNALRYEAALSVACGAKCSIGDQLHPSGKMEEATYRLIGSAYAEIEQKEPWLDGVRAVSDVGLLSAEAYHGARSSNATATDAGAARILLESHILFDVLDLESDFSPYRVIILPDVARMTPALQQKLQQFVDGGGKLLATGESALTADGNALAFDFGVTYDGKSDYHPTYLRPVTPYDNMEDTAYVMYGQAHRTSLAEGGIAHAMMENPYFNRTAEHFCSHQHTPNNVDVPPAGVAISEGKDGIYIAYDVFRDYAATGILIDKRMVQLALSLLLTQNKTAETSLPAQGVLTLMEQPAHARYVCHLLYASPVRRGNGVEIIEDIIPLHNVALTLRLPRPVRRAYLAPQMTELPMEQNGQTVTLTVPTVDCHQMVVLE